PQKCLIRSYVADGKYPGEVFNTPLITDVLKVSEYATKPVPEELFTLKYTTPGTNVTDKSLPEASGQPGGVTYKIPANPQDLDRVIEEARAMAQASAGRERWRNVIKTVLI